MFTCTGMCLLCGKCHNGENDKETSDRKEKLISFPEDFVPDTEEDGYGIAYDIGTTTVVALLWDFRLGKLAGTKSMTNPQIRYGSDVISRIAFSMEEGHPEILQKAIAECLTDLTEKICTEHDIDRKSIIRAVACGNTTMSHLLLGVDPGSLARAPFTPGYTGTIFCRAKDLGIIINDDIELMVMPNIAGHVGGDISSGIVAVRLDEAEGTALLIDVGTNGEIVLSSGGKLWTCSTAAGPAFEGASISQGMRAVSGAVEKVKIENGDVSFKVIGNVPPTGICGSGLIDAVSEMVGKGLIDKTGRLLSDKDYVRRYGESPLKNRLIKDETGRKMILVKKKNDEDIFITQKDIREVQLAKGAIKAAVNILLKKSGKQIREIDKIYLAGAFGNFIDKKSAVSIGLLPDIDPERIIPVGNAAGAGALMILAQPGESDRLQQIMATIEHVNLSDESEFQMEYIKSMGFGVD